MTSTEEHAKEDTPKPEEEDSDEDDDDVLVFTQYTQESWEHQLEDELKRQEREEDNKRNQGEAHLVDGELQFVSEEHHGPVKTRNPNLVEGNTLKEDIEPEFPKWMYGKPVEEIDKLIRERDKVRHLHQVMSNTPITRHSIIRHVVHPPRAWTRHILPHLQPDSFH